MNTVNQTKTDRQGPPSVVVFGAGITGLTAAHELVERGWKVTVVEPEIDPLNVEECAVGGLAKTQWSVYQARHAEPKGPTEARPLVSTVRLRPKQGATQLVGTLEAAGIRADMKLEDAQQRLGWAVHDFKTHLDKILDDGSIIYLERVVARLKAIHPFAPYMAVTYGAKADVQVAKCLAMYLRSLEVRVDEPTGDDALPPRVWQIETDLSDLVSEDHLPEHPAEFSGIVPGEHGFRFFPAFYRHLFDTLRRIPVRGDNQGFGDTYRTVYDNLIPTEANWLAVDDEALRPCSKAAREHGVVRFPRRLRKSLREYFDAFNDMYTELGYTTRDLELLKLRLFKYMTSCRRRRNEEYEGMSWWDFMGLSDLSPACQQDMERAPQLLAAMTAKQSDARTQGNVATQLLLDPINADEHVDSTLNAPTTVAWFAPWKDYLLSQGVRFVPARLVAFDVEDGEIRPRIAVDHAQKPGQANPDELEIRQAEYYVLAIPVQAWSEPGHQQDAPKHRCDATNLFECWEAARRRIGASPDHVSRLGDWLKEHVLPRPDRSDSLYKGLAGIQFYFDSDQSVRSGHMLFMDSPWRLSAISQASFWNRRREPFDSYRGIVSVDIGALDSPRHDDPIRSFWNTPRGDVHSTVWDQIVRGNRYASRTGATALDAGSGKEAPPPYRVYRIDESIVYAPKNGTPVKNRAPFLINGVHEWDDRPGWDVSGTDEPSSAPVEVPSGARYQLMPVFVHRDETEQARPRWVLAGTFMQTWTRATTMESANESARHAVNSLLRDARARHDHHAELCRIWDPERYEHPDLRIWQELDEKLYEWDGGEPLPHMIDILELEAIPDALLETGDLSEVVEGLVGRIAAKGVKK